MLYVFCEYIDGRVIEMLIHISLQRGNNNHLTNPLRSNLNSTSRPKTPSSMRKKKDSNALDFMYTYINNI